MSIQSRNSAEDWASVSLAYLRFLGEEGSSGVRAALFVTNCHGEPLEFCFTRVNLPSDSLWGIDAAYRRAAADLARALFAEVRHRPDVALVLSEETPVDFSAEDLAAQFPVGLVAGEDDQQVHWLGPEPDAESSLAGLVQLLASRRRLPEPFARAALGLEEAYAHL